MLIAIARRVTTHRPLDRTLLVAVAVILGLLTMHSMSGHVMTSGHGSVVVDGRGGTVVEAQSSTATHRGGHPAEMSGGDSAAPMKADCGTCSEVPRMAWMACVLALLVGAVLLVRSTMWRRSRGTVPGWAATPTRHAYPRRRPVPPSLIVLCISRT